MKGFVRGLGLFILIAGIIGSFLLGNAFQITEIGYNNRVYYQYNYYLCIGGILSSVVMGCILLSIADVLEMTEESRDNTKKILKYLNDNGVKTGSSEKPAVKSSQADARTTVLTDEIKQKAMENAGKTGINPKGLEAVYPVPCADPSHVYCPVCNTLQVEGRHVCQKCGVPFMY